MAKTATTTAQVDFTDPFASVEVQAISVAGETVPSRIAVRVQDDAGTYHVKGLLGKDYQLLPNRKVRDLAEDIMSRTPDVYGGFTNLKTLWDGKRYVDYFASRNPVAELTNGSRLDLHLGLMAWNSYDGTRKTGFEIFALNPFCTNQYHSRNRFGFFAWRHTPAEADQIDMEDALQSIAMGAQALIAVAPKFHALKQQALTTDVILDAHRTIKFPKSRWGDVLDQLGREEANSFGLYQALTNVISHGFEGWNGLNVGTEVTEYFLDERRQVLHHTTAEAVLSAAERN